MQETRDSFNSSTIFWNLILKCHRFQRLNGLEIINLFSIINDNTFSKLLDNWNVDLDKLPDPLRCRTRYLGLLRLIKKYGGVIMPNSFLMLRDFQEFSQAVFRGFNFMLVNF